MTTSKEISNRLKELEDRLFYHQGLDLSYRQKLIEELENFSKQKWIKIEEK